MKIRSKIFLNLFLVAVFSLAAVSGAFYYFGRKIIIENIAGYNYLLAQDDIDSIDRFIDRRLERWQSYLASNADLFQALKKSNDQFAGMAGREEFFAAQDKAWRESDKASITPFMKEILDNPISVGLRLRVAFYEARTGYNIFPELFITNQYGALVAATGKTSDYLQSSEDWWQKAKAEGVWVSNVIFDESSGTYGLEFCLRVDDESGDFLGVAKVVYDIRDIFKIIDDPAKLLADNRGISDFEISRKTVSVSLLTNDGKSIYSTNGGFGGLEDRQDLVSIQNGSYFIRVDEGVEELYSHAHSRGSGGFRGLGWVLIIEKETKEVLAPLAALLNWLWLVVLLTFGVATVIALWLSYSFNKPIKKIKDYVEQVESGDLSVRINGLGRDEIGQLGGAFGKMVAAVRGSRREVEKKVAAQTAEIREKAAALADQKSAILNILEDVEKEKAKTELLAKDLEKFKLAVDNASDHIVITDAEGIILYANRGVEKITGYAIKEVVGRKVGSRVNWGGLMNLDVYKNLWQVIKEKKQVFIGELKNRRKNGEDYEVLASISPVLGENGEVLFFVGIERDITHEKQIDKAKTEFVSLASHQLRTPLSAINWYAEMLIEGDAGKINKKQKDYLGDIYKANQRMVVLINALLNVSRIELGTFIVEPTPTDLIDVANSVINELGPQIKDKKQILRKDFDKIGIMPLDSKLIRIVLQNLLSNAVKYTPAKGQIAVSIKKTGSEIRLAVSDTGLGIPKEAQAKIFSKLFRADNAKQVDADGTGLGLYLVKAIVDNIGGKVWFESKEKAGTTFFVTLPSRGMQEKKGTRELT